MSCDLLAIEVERTSRAPVKARTVIPLAGVGVLTVAVRRVAAGDGDGDRGDISLRRCAVGSVSASHADCLRRLSHVETKKLECRENTKVQTDFKWQQWLNLSQDGYVMVRNGGGR